ncbi:MAG: leucine-rich repeat protein [Bacteroidales bacterium]|nr:leucine-rich repeat protein [Bacteroidales bacterium]
MRKFFTIIVFMTFVTTVFAQTFDFSAVCQTGQTLYYQIEAGGNNTVALVAPGYPSWTGYDRPAGNVIVPEQVEYQGNIYTVVKVYGDVFRRCQELTSVVFPNTVTYIAAQTFYEDAALETVVLPNGLTSIENWMFCDCSSLTSVIFPDSLTNISDLAFYGCSSLVSISLPNTLETIGLAAFYLCSSLNGDLVLPSSLQSLGSSCFQHCSGLTGVVIPENLGTIPEAAFNGCTSLSGELVIPDQCTFIGSEAFSGCSSLSSLTIGSSVATIGQSAFMDCVGLEAIHCNTLTPPYTPPIQNNPYGDEQHVVFYNVPADIPVYVNCLSMDQFLANVNWMQFTNIQGVFLGVPELTVNVNNAEFGTAEIVSLPSDCDQTIATVRAIPYAGHHFGCWKSGNAVVSYEPEYSFTLNHNHSLTAYFDVAYVMTDSIGYPDHVIGRKYNGANLVTAEYVSDFTYNNQNGVLDHFYFPNAYRYTRFSFLEYPSMPSSISSSIGWGESDELLTMDPPVTTELLTFTYEDDHQIRHSDHYKGNDYYDEINNHYDFYYNNHRLYQKDSSCTEDGETWIFARNRYSYENGNKTQIDSAFSGNNLRLSTVTTNIYDDAHRIQDVQTVSFNASGEITAQTRKIYSYTTNNKTDTIITQTFSDGEWVNSGIAHYVYDNKNRVVEYQTGSWSADNSDWNITKKILYSFIDETQKVIISFRKKNNGEWGWDVFSGQSLFNDSRLYEWQRQLSSYSGFQVNQFEISMHYNMVETAFPMLSEWYYEIQMENGIITYQHLECASDTTINNDRAKVIVRTNQIYDKEGQTQVTHEYIKEENNKVYWWNKGLHEFTILYDYAAEEGDEWEIKVGTESILVHVDGVEAYEHDGETYNMLHISDMGNVFSGDIIVGIGHTTSFFPEMLMRSASDFKVDGLRCYLVQDALLYHDGDKECDAVSLYSVDEIETQGFVVYPNPTDGLLHVETRLTTSLQEYRITNIMGQTLLTGSSPQIDVSSLSPGLYFITLGTQTLKFTKQ